MKKWRAVFICCIPLLFLCSCSGRPSEDIPPEEELYSSGYNDGYNDGYDDGYAKYEDVSEYSGPVYEAYYEIEDMNPGDVLAYLEETSGERIFTQDEARSLYALAFQRGYTACQTGRWDIDTDEFLSSRFSDAELDAYLPVFEANTVG